MNTEQVITVAKQQRDETILQMTYLIKDLQEDLERLIKHKHEPTDEGLTPQSGHWGYFISQHCLRYEQTMKAGWKMEELARMATWMMTYEKDTEQ